MIVIQALLIATMIAGLACMIFAMFMLARNSWVYRVRSEMLDRDYHRYLRLAPYDEMMRRFWVWDVAAFERGRR